MKKVSIIFKYSIGLFFLLCTLSSISFSQESEEKSASLYLYFSNEGVYPDDSVLEDPFNPYANYLVPELEAIRWDHVKTGNPRDDFFVWATYLALSPNAEAQYYAAVALEEASLKEEVIRGIQGRGVVYRGFSHLKEQAVKAYQVVIDYWPQAMSYDPRKNERWSLADGARESIYRLGNVPTINRPAPFTLAGGQYIMRMVSNNTTSFYQYDWAWHPEGLVTEKGGINQYHSLLLDIGLKYGNKINGICGIEMFANQVSFLDKPSGSSFEDNVGVVISKVDLNLYGDLFDTWIFKNVGHYNWGDIFGFYREMYDTEWAKQANAFTPHGVEINGKQILDGVTIIAGEDPIWGNNSELFMKYEKSIGITNFKLMYKDKLVKDNVGTLSSPVGFIAGVEQYYDFNPWDNQMTAFSFGVGERRRVSLECEVEKVDADEDNLAFGAKSRIKFIPDTVELLVQYIDAEIYAGNKKELYLEAKLSPLPFIILSSNYTDRKNIQEAMSLFPSVVLDNREGTIIKESIIFDTTPEVPFRLWDGRFNEQENAPFALELGYQMADYPGYTDRQIHYEYANNVWWEEAPGSKGRSPAKLDGFFAKLVVNPFGRGDRIILNFNTGLKQATAGTDCVIKEKTRFKDIELNTKIGFFRGRINIILDDWKPYQIDGPLYGMTFDERFIVYLGRVFDYKERFKLGLEYEQVNDQDKSAEYTEYRLICSLKF